MLTPQQYEAIDQIMDNFRFDFVTKIMKATSWKWATSDGKMEEPCETALRKAARQMLKKAAIEGGSVSSGGLRAVLLEDGELCLAFIPEEWCSEGPYT